MSYYKESITAMTGGEEFIGWNCPSWEDFQEGNCCGGEQVVMGEWIDTRWVEAVMGIICITDYTFQDT